MNIQWTADSALPPIRGLPHGAPTLVVEDRTYYRHSRKTLRTGLQSLGLEVFCAPSSARASRILESIPIDLLILDIHHPKTAVGLDWVRSVRQHLPDLPLIVLAEQRHDELERNCDALGAAAYLSAPVSFRTLRRCIERAFDCRRHLQEIQRLKQRLTDAQACAGPKTAAIEPEHQVDDLWFAIFERLLVRTRMTAPPLA